MRFDYVEIGGSDMGDNTPKKILFIQSGISFYYPMIEVAILNSLQKVNSDTSMVSPEKAIKTALKMKPDFILVLSGLSEEFNHIMPFLKKARVYYWALANRRSLLYGCNTKRCSVL